MKRILYIAQQAYPITSSECICNTKVAHALAEAGYKVDVFSYTSDSMYTADNKINRILSSSKNLNIHYVKASSNDYFLSRSHSLWKNIKNAFVLFYFGCKMGYLYNGIAINYDIYRSIKSHLKSFKEFPYDVVMTRSYHSEIIGIYLKKKYGVKWVANWNDPYPVCRFPKPYGKGPDAKLDIGYGRVYDKVKKMVDFHTFPSERLKEYMINSFKTVSSNNTMVIPHMAYSRLLPSNRVNRDKCLRIVSCGTVRHPRNPSLFIKALKKVVDDMCLSANDLKCYFIGKYDKFLDKLVKDNSLEEYVTLVGPMQYADCLDFISKCDISLIIEAQCEEGIYLPTKFADAVQCGVPVFCVSPKVGTLHDLVEKYKNGYYSDNESLESIEKSLKQAVLDYRNDNLPIRSKSDMEDFYEEKIVEKINSILLK